MLWPAVDVYDLQLIIAVIEREMPGWWWSGGVCSVSAHASCGPDASGGDAWLLSDKRFDGGFHADLDQPAQLADALRAAFTEARAARRSAYEKQASKPDTSTSREGENEGQSSSSEPQPAPA
jgi:hypothetical protein